MRNTLVFTSPDFPNAIQAAQWVLDHCVTSDLISWNGEELLGPLTETGRRRYGLRYVIQVERDLDEPLAIEKLKEDGMIKPKQTK